MLVWKKTWDHISATITKIFEASLRLGHHPRKWKIASIFVLRKPGKADYSEPGAYRPISLLNTLGKLLDSVIARRLSYYVENYRLLPETQFGGRPGRTTEQALLILTNAIHRAWLKNKVVTLVAFDLKGAFNGVKANVLDRCLANKGIPRIIRNWIASFMQHRTAGIRFDDYCNKPSPLKYDSLAQGLPLSPPLSLSTMRTWWTK